MKKNLKSKRKSRLQLKNLIKYGYFPEELPPVFNTISFSENLKSLTGLVFSKKNSEPLVFTIPKKRLNRRKLMIPNPYHYLELCKVIISNQEQVFKYTKSKNSSSTPVIVKKGGSISTKETYSQFLFKCFQLSHGMDYELKTDISRFYPTIYTHTIPWIIHGKELAKKERFNAGFLGNQIDKTLRDVQSQQTFGIPIGPHASNIVAEIICAYIDQTIIYNFPELRFRRFRDDYHFYFSNKEDGEKILRIFESSLSELLLEKNEEKTGIREVPVSLEAEWVFLIREFIVRKDSNEQREDIISLFSLVLRFAREFPDSQVVKYSLYKFSADIINDENVDIVIRLLFRLVELDSRSIKDFSRLVGEYGDRVNKKILKNEINVLLNKYINKNYTVEVLWLLWLNKVFKIKIKDNFVKKIISGKDSLSIIMILDLRDNKMVSKKISIKNLLSRIKSTNFDEDWWLLKYEAHLNKWINQTISEPFFKELIKKKVSFYNSEIISFEKKMANKKKSLKSYILSWGIGGFY